MENFGTVTLENRLRELAAGSESVDSLDRSYHEIKEDMKRYLPAIFSYYPHYSAHDASHSQSLISAIELILGERRIMALSPADVWLILVSAQLHDVGMIIPNEEIERLSEEPDFKRYLEGMRLSSDTDFSRAAVILLDRAIPDENEAWYLDIRQSVTLLVAEYLRRQHAERSDSVVSGDTAISRMLSLKLNGETSRAFASVGKICAMHGLDFQRIFTLYETDSITNFRSHPRFAAALIRLGDLCDVDNGRFNAALMAVFGRLPQSSLVHFYKHRTITRLCISEREICMSADIPFDAIKKELSCDGKDCIIRGEDFCHKIVYEHQRWFKMIETELQNLMLHAGRIFPAGMDQSMPSFHQEILVNGKRSMFAGSNLRLNFAPEKAYALIEGMSLYDEQRTFVREIVQNSLDAMKIQLWRDLKDGRWNAYLPMDKRDRLSDLQPFDLCREIYEYYHVEITTHTDADTGRKTITFRDNGIGISYKDLQNNIIRTGASWDTRSDYENDLSSMPPWMRPTGGFGIGLHAAFAVTSRIEIKSRTRYESQPKYIIIHSGQQDGFVFARDIEEQFQCGTQTVIEIDKELSEIRAQESDITPYDDQPDDEFAFFIEEYMEEMICCPLFPVKLNGKAVGNILCVCEAYGAVFDSSRRDEINGMYLAVSDDVPMRYIVWDPAAGHFYRILPENVFFEYETRCSFKGVYLSNKLIRVYYSDMFHMESVECLSVDSKRAIGADRKGFLSDYKKNIQNITKKVCRALVLFGDQQFSSQINEPIGNFTMQEFLELCDKVVQFQNGDPVMVSDERKILLDQFIEILEKESDTKKVIYIFYLAFAMLRYEVACIKQFLEVNPVPQKDDKSVFVHQMFSYLQFEKVSCLFEYIYDKLGSGHIHGFKKDSESASEKAYGRPLGSSLGSTFGSAFFGAFNNEFGNVSGSMFGSIFGRIVGLGWGDQFKSEFSSNFDHTVYRSSEFSNLFDFISLPAETFGKQLLGNQWEWIAWIGYCEKLSPLCINSIYFKSIPAFWFNFNVENADSVIDLLSMPEISILYKNFINTKAALPFEDYLHIKEITLKNNELICTLKTECEGQETISDTSSLSVYYRQIDRNKINVLCPDKYVHLGIRYFKEMESFIWEFYFNKNLFILLPKKIEETDFFDFPAKNRGMGTEVIVEIVLRARDTVNILQYIYLHRQDKSVTPAMLQEEYRCFLTELISARLEEIQDTSEDTVRNV